MAFLFAGADSIAQESNYREKASHFYATAEFNMTGADYQGWGKPDSGSYGFTVSPADRKKFIRFPRFVNRHLLRE